MSADVLPLRPGEPVTIVYKTFTICGVVETSSLTEFTVLDFAGRSLLTECGRRWLRGHHLPDTDLVRAACAAEALWNDGPQFASSMPPPPTAATGAGSAGVFPRTGSGTPWPFAPKTLLK